jgi:hypothetical protein
MPRMYYDCLTALAATKKIAVFYKPQRHLGPTEAACKFLIDGY